ncbi:MAG: hypothetical protein ACFFC7_32915 [Candidatus Hermodarchaeota archaeon]
MWINQIKRSSEYLVRFHLNFSFHCFFEDEIFNNSEKWLDERQNRLGVLQRKDIQVDELIIKTNLGIISYTGELADDTISNLRDINKSSLKKYLLKNRLISLFSEMELYLYRCFRYILLKYPEKMGEKTVKFKQLLFDSNLETLKEEIIEKELYNLFYENFKEIFDYAKKKLDIIHNLGNEVLARLQEFKLIRNAFVHGEGTVNYLFYSKTRNKNLKVGESIELTEELLVEAAKVVESCLIEFDKSFVKNFPELLYQKGKIIKNW